MLKRACDGFKLGSGCGLRVPTQRPVQYLYNTGWFFELLLGPSLHLALTITPVVVLTPLTASVPRVVRVGAVAFSPSMPFSLVLLLRD